MRPVRAVVLAGLLAAAMNAFDEHPLNPKAVGTWPLRGAVNPVGIVHADPPPHCQIHYVPVALTPHQAVRIFGELCMPPDIDPRQVRTVHLAIAGGTYGHLYNNWPYNPDTYSYAQALMRAGYAVYTFDRIGTARSSHPAGSAVTIEADAYVLHQLVQRLRNGTIGQASGAAAFQRVVLMGHSLGSIAALAEASTYRDVDGVVLTGFSHALAAVDFASQVLPFLEPANRDPRFAGRNLDADHLTTAPSRRGGLFYYLPVTDSNVVALDEQTKETVTTGELGSMLPLLGRAASQAVLVPVLVLNGEYDQWTCGVALSVCASGAALTAAEAPFWSPQACLRAAVIPGTGHALNLEPSAPLTYAIIQAWSDAFVGRDRPAPSCRPACVTATCLPTVGTPLA
jgi:pimeloyl-ACP methyl ester carboxylesterase